jgi:hypothetical protein
MAKSIRYLRRYFYTFKEPRKGFQGIYSVSLCILAGQSDNPIHTQFLASIDCSKIPALVPVQFQESIFPITRSKIPPQYEAIKKQLKIYLPRPPLTIKFRARKKREYKLSIVSRKVQSLHLLSISLSLSRYCAVKYI